MNLDRKTLAELIVRRIGASEETYRREFAIPGRVPSFIVDGLLPEDTARAIFQAFPPKEKMVPKKSLREYKYIAAQMDRYAPILEEIIYAFQEPPVVSLISELTGMKRLLPDEKLYAGGISLMAKENYLNPHLDNSHDLERKNYRALNLLYYVTPDWKEEYGGNLELWDEGPGKPGRTIHSRFNRLVVMATGKTSWHSVSPVRHDGVRTCVSNYYFSPDAPGGRDYFHVTSFRGRPDEKIKDAVLRADHLLRNAVRRVFKKGLVKTKHLYSR